MNLNAQINDLIDAHPDFLGCTGCNQCKEIHELVQKLERTPKQRYQHILDKGSDMSTKEVAQLIAKGVLKDDIQEALEMDREDFNRLYNKFKPVLAHEEDGSITAELYIQYRRESLSNSVIAEKFELDEKQLAALIKRWRRSHEITPAEFRSLPRVNWRTRISFPFTKEQYLKDKEQGLLISEQMKKYNTTRYAILKAMKHYKEMA